MATLLWGTPLTADVPTWSTTLAGLTTGSYSLSSVIDNTSNLVESAGAQIISSAATAGNVSAGGYVGLWLMYAFDGTNYPIPGGSTAGATGQQMTAAINGLSGATWQNGNTPASFTILPFKFKILLLNSLGQTLPTGATLSLYRWAETIA